MLGEIQFEEFEGLTKMPQDVATAWTAGIEHWTGVNLKPIKFLGRQVCKGTNYWFFAEETTTGNPAKKVLGVFAINGFAGKYAIVPSSFEELKFQI